MMPLPHTVTVTEPTVGVDGRGDPTSSYGSGTGVRGWMQQIGQSEVLGDRDQRSSGWTLISNQTPDMTSLARVQWNGLTFQVDGQPNHRWNDRVYDHTSANLRLVEG